MSSSTRDTQRRFSRREDDPPSLFADDGGRARAVAVDELAKRRAPYEGMPEREPLDRRTRSVIVLAVVFAAVFALVQFVPGYVVGISLDTGPASWLPTPAAFAQAVAERASRVFTMLSGGASFYDETLSVYIMLALVGAGLGLSGAVYQGAFRNALASPSTLGVMSGATLGAALYCAVRYAPEGDALFMGWEEWRDSANPFELLWYNWGCSISAFAMSMVVVCIVLLVSMTKCQARASKVYAVITGQVVAAIVTGIYGVIKSYYARTEPDSLRATVISGVQASSVGGVSDLVTLACLAVPLAALVVVVMLNHRKLTLLSFGEKETESMGVATGGLRVGLIVACTLLTAVIVAFCGPIGFVGFFMPHVVRKIVGPNFKYLLPGTMFLSATFCVAMYAAASFFSAPQMVGMLVSLVGSVAFLVIALRQRGSRHGDWL